MKIVKIVILLISLSFTSVICAQTHEDLYEQAKMEEDAKRVVEKVIDALAAQNPKVPTSKWSEVKSQLDYSNHKAQIVSVLKKYYTAQEVKVVFLQNDMFKPINTENVFIFKTKEEATEDMYRAGKLAGRDLMKQALILVHQ